MCVCARVRARVWSVRELSQSGGGSGRVGPFLCACGVCVCMRAACAHVYARARVCVCARARACMRMCASVCVPLTRPRGPIFGARADVAATSPPTARITTYDTALGSILGGILTRLSRLQRAHKRGTEGRVGSTRQNVSPATSNVRVWNQPHAQSCDCALCGETDTCSLCVCVCARVHSRTAGANTTY